MKLLNCEGRQSPAQGGNDSMLTAPGESGRMGFRTGVQFPSPPPSLLYKIDDRPKKSDFSDFFAYLELKIFSVKP